MARGLKSYSKKSGADVPDSCLSCFRKTGLRRRTSPKTRATRITDHSLKSIVLASKVVSGGNARRPPLQWACAVFPAGHLLRPVPRLNPTPVEDIDQLCRQGHALASSSILHVRADQIGRAHV